MDDDKTLSGANPAPEGGANPATNPAPATGGAGNVAGTEGGNATNDSNPKGGGTIAGDAGKTAGANPAAPVSYDFKDSVGQYSKEFEWSDKDNEKFVGLIKDMNLSNEQANNILKYGMEWGKGIIGQISDQIMSERKSWGDDAIAQLGAEKDSTLALVGSAVSHIEKTIPGIRQALDETGAGNRIELIRAFALVGKMLQSDPGKAAAVGAQGAKATENLYPNTDFGKYA